MINIEDGKQDLWQAVSDAISLRGNSCEIKKESCLEVGHKFIQKNLFVLQEVYSSTVSRRIDASDIVLSCYNCFYWHVANREDAIAEGIIVR